MKLSTKHFGARKSKGNTKHPLCVEAPPALADFSSTANRLPCSSRIIIYSANLVDTYVNR